MVVYIFRGRWAVFLGFLSNSCCLFESTEEETYGNADLNPENMRTLEANLAYTTRNKKAYFSLAAYRSWAENLILLSNPSDSLLIYPITSESIPLYINFDKLTYYGIEFEGKNNLSKHWQITSAFSWQQVQHDADEEDAHNAGEHEIQQGYTSIPPVMLKVGVLYKNAKKGVSVGVFDSYFSKPALLNQFGNDDGDDEPPKSYNPKPNAYHYLSVNLTLDIRNILNIDNIPTTTFSLFVQNALNAKIYYADYVRSEVNSIAERGGRGIYGRAMVKFWGKTKEHTSFLQIPIQSKFSLSLSKVLALIRSCIS
jgi:outer membrane receptor protein involved in Fe transport